MHSWLIVAFHHLIFACFFLPVLLLFLLQRLDEQERSFLAATAARDQQKQVEMKMMLAEEIPKVCQASVYRFIFQLKSKFCLIQKVGTMGFLSFFVEPY
jgi:hypothetical protein